MKRLLLSTALTLALTGTAAFAQQAQPTLPENSTPNANAPYHHQHRHAPNPQNQAEMISKKLNLSADQTAKLTPILTDRAQKSQALIQDQSLTPDQRHAQMKAIHEKHRAAARHGSQPGPAAAAQVDEARPPRHWGQRGPERQQQPGSAAESQRPLA